MEQQQRQEGWPLVARGEVYPEDRLPAGSYACQIRGEAKEAYGDYVRIHMPRDIPEEEKGKVPTAPIKEFSEEEYLRPGAYVCPTKGEAKAAYGDYRRIGDPGTFPDA